MSIPWIYRAVRPLLFRLEPERAHRLTLALLGWVSRWPLPTPRSDPRLGQELWNRQIPNPIGLAAGLDKDCEAAKSFVFMGLGFLEVGTVTPRPQPGNPPPRLLRHPARASLQNWLGFNNAGLAAMRRRLQRIYPLPVPIGVNLGRNRSTPDGHAADDYAALVDGLAAWCDFFVVNVSSPNTPGLRDLQAPERLRALVGRLSGASERPLLVKLSPDLPTGEGERLADVALEAGAAGLVLTNTTVDYELVPGAPRRGGLSGGVLRERSFALLEEVAAACDPDTVLVSVGGIDSGAEVYRRLRAGARLTEVYTALVYGGPGLPRRLQAELLELMDGDGLSRLEDVIGADR